MGLFEENPWLLVPIIVLTVEVWDRVKGFARSMISKREARRIDG